MRSGDYRALALALVLLLAGGVESVQAGVLATNMAGSSGSTTGFNGQSVTTPLGGP